MDRSKGRRVAKDQTNIRRASRGNAYIQANPNTATPNPSLGQTPTPAPASSAPAPTRSEAVTKTATKTASESSAAKAGATSKRVAAVEPHPATESATAVKSSATTAATLGESRLGCAKKQGRKDCQKNYRKALLRSHSREGAFGIRAADRSWPKRAGVQRKPAKNHS